MHKKTRASWTTSIAPLPYHPHPPVLSILLFLWLHTGQVMGGGRVKKGFESWFVDNLLVAQSWSDKSRYTIAVEKVQVSETGWRGKQQQILTKAADESPDLKWVFDVFLLYRWMHHCTCKRDKQYALETTEGLDVISAYLQVTLNVNLW